MEDKKRNEEPVVYAYWLARIQGISAKKKRLLLEQFGSAGNLYHAEIFMQDLLRPEELAKLRQAQKESLTELDQQYAFLQTRGIRFVPFFDPAYPARLETVPSPPFALYVKGRLPDPDRPSVAIVGARTCTLYGEKMALAFGQALAGAGVQVISGMARGIDGAGQRGALSEAERTGGTAKEEAAGAANGKADDVGKEADGQDRVAATFGVLGGGVDVCYPRENIGLYMDIQKRGGLLSEQLPGSAPKPNNFPARNRIISGLADVVLVMEAREKSGSLITADMALDMGKDVYALPGPVTSPLSAGCHRLIRQGAGILLSPEDLLEELGLAQSGGQHADHRRQADKETDAGAGAADGRQEDEVRENSDKNEKILASRKNLVYSFLDFSPKGIQELARESRLAPAELLDELVALEIEGKVKEVSKNFYIRTC